MTQSQTTKRRIVSAETRLKISNAKKGVPRPDMIGHPLWGSGRPVGTPMTEEGKRKISEAKTGVPLSAEHKARITATAKRGVEHHIWKGDKVSYRNLHRWVERYLGTPSECTECGFTSSNGRQFHWANISRQYKRDLDDWIRLCVRCHFAYDSNKLTLTQERG